MICGHYYTSSSNSVSTSAHVVSLNLPPYRIGRLLSLLGIQRGRAVPLRPSPYPSPPHLLLPLGFERSKFHTEGFVPSFASLPVLYTGMGGGQGWQRFRQIRGRHGKVSLCFLLPFLPPLLSVRFTLPLPRISLPHPHSRRGQGA